MEFGPVIPVLRSFDETKMREFYLGFLGFAVTFEHRFEPHMPLYAGLQRGACTLHLSEHHGDGSPGANVRIATENLDAYHAELTSKQHKNCRPGIELQPWGLREMSVMDPFGNRLVFFDPTYV